MNADDREYVRRLGRVAGGSAVRDRTAPADASKGDVRAALELLATGEPAGAGTKPMPYKEWVRAVARNALSAPHQGETGDWNSAIDAAAKVADEWSHRGDPAVAVYAGPRIRDGILRLKRAEPHQGETARGWPPSDERIRAALPPALARADKEWSEE